jgi:hypothetical protein
MFDDVSKPLVSEVCLYLHADDLQKVALFKGCEAGFVVRVVRLFEPRIFLPGDYIIVKGAIGKEMFFLRKGRCSVLASIDGEVDVVAEIAEGSSFGYVHHPQPLFIGMRSTIFFGSYSPS